MMQKMVVSLGERSYPITIAAGLFSESASYWPLTAHQSVMVVTNETIAPLYLQTVLAQLAALGINADSVVLPDGEQYKSLTVLD